MKGAVQKESFSQVLFRALGFPEIRPNGEQNITMHQVLRLIYLDQVSHLDSLLRDEQFDSALTRSTVGDLLLGTYDASLYADQLELADKDRDLAASASQFESILEVFGQTEQEINAEQLNDAINSLEEQRERVEASLESDEGIAPFEPVSPDVNELGTELQGAKERLYEMEVEEKALEFEIVDSRLFIQSLESRATALDESASTRAHLGDLPLTRCPQCLTPIRQEDVMSLCSLCKEPIQESAHGANIARMRQELAQQLKESTFLVGKKELRLHQISRAKPQVLESVRRLSAEYSRLTLAVRSERDASIDELLIKKGSLDSKIEAFHQHAKTVGVLNALKERRVALEATVARLRISILEKQKQQERRGVEAHETIGRYACDLLRADLPRQEAFQSAKRVAFSFKSNTFQVDGENQFSASSMVYLKNSIHFAIFLASSELEFFRYPRLFLCDNIEDKGMEAARSQNFQRLVVKISEDLGVDHQIIFATSMIAPDLNNSKYCVGPEYSPTSKSLKL